MSATGRSAAAQTGHVRHPDDYFRTPRACVEAIVPYLHFYPGAVLDPCCGDGAILDVFRPNLRTYGIEIDSDRTIQANSKQHSVWCHDALDPACVWPWPVGTVVTNPPYSLAQEFIERAALERPTVDRAFLLRLNFLGSQKRVHFHRQHRADIFVLPKRPSFTPDGKTDACEYAWFVYGLTRGGHWHVLDLPRDTA